MKKCPFIDECEDEVTEWVFKRFCQGWVFKRFCNCSRYQQMLKAKKGKPYRQEPKEWKKEKEMK